MDKVEKMKRFDSMMKSNSQPRDAEDAMWKEFYDKVHEDATANETNGKRSVSFCDLACFQLRISLVESEKTEFIFISRQEWGKERWKNECKIAEKNDFESSPFCMHVLRGNCRKTYEK